MRFSVCLSVCLSLSSERSYTDLLLLAKLDGSNAASGVHRGTGKANYRDVSVARTKLVVILPCIDSTAAPFASDGFPVVRPLVSLSLYLYLAKLAPRHRERARYAS